MDIDKERSWVGSELLSEGEIYIPGAIDGGETFDAWVYILDYRGSAKVASESKHVQKVVP
jgi:hypothetical protein